MSYLYFIGIDVSKDCFDVVVHDKAAKPKAFPNSSEGFAALLSDLRDILPHALIIAEATGGYETGLLIALCKAGMAVHRIQPLKAAHYIRSLRIHGKTDALDAAALAQYGAERYKSLALFIPADDTLQSLQDLHTRREDLLKMRVAETQRLKHPRYKNLKQSVKAVRDVLDAQIAAIEARMHALIDANRMLKTKKDALTAFKGIGDTTALCLLCAMPELGKLTRRQAASLAGLAPHPKDSGKYHGYRATKGGRQNVRKALFMAALSAKRYNPQLKAFYEQLVQRGKKPIVALIATMRKMIVILNAKIRDLCYPELKPNHGR